MTYEDLVAFCGRAVSATPGQQLTLLDCVACLAMHNPANRAITSESLARFMAEFIEYDRRKKVVH